MTRLLQLALLTLVMLGAASVVTGCNTMEGFGEDVESAGESIEGEAEEQQE